MRVYNARVAEIRLNREGRPAVWIECPGRAIPAPGRYTLADAGESLLATPLFAAEIGSGGFLSAASIPGSWAPGTLLQLRGPLGKGFNLPTDTQKLALIALGETAARLLCLAAQAEGKGLAVALFGDLPTAALPVAIEAHPLSALPEALFWADFLALDLPLADLPILREKLRLAPASSLRLLGQALVTAPMPCGGLADCGVCASPGRGEGQLVCKSGPVFNLDKLEW